MTETLIALLSILIGIIGANLIGYFSKKYSFGFTGNTLVGVFGSIFFMKLFGHLGLNPNIIMQTGSVNVILFILNLTTSFLGGILAVVLLKKLQNTIKNI
jgi:uncharacterized membrane protein YeaQ/YmgE (transglycosylase-associated protein family)